MCLISKRKKPYVLKRDRRCWKILCHNGEGLLLSVVRGMKYELGRLYTEESEPEVETDESTSCDDTHYLVYGGYMHAFSSLKETKLALEGVYAYPNEDVKKFTSDGNVGSIGFLTRPHLNFVKDQKFVTMDGEVLTTNCVFISSMQALKNPMDEEYGVAWLSQGRKDMFERIFVKEDITDEK